jgi:hypothetical protein
MAGDFNKSEPPKQDLEAMAAEMVRIWEWTAVASPHIAAARRTIFLAYVAEGFTEAQALELIKQV